MRFEGDTFDEGQARAGDRDGATGSFERDGAGRVGRREFLAAGGTAATLAAAGCVGGGGDGGPLTVST